LAALADEASAWPSEQPHLRIDDRQYGDDRRCGEAGHTSKAAARRQCDRNAFFPSEHIRYHAAELRMAVLVMLATRHFDPLSRIAPQSNSIRGAECGPKNMNTEL
jgi:hypothetical protein